MDNRTEKYRQVRLLKRKCRLVFLLSLILLVLGVCAADYSVNTLVKNDKRISFISFSRQGNYYRASFLNMSFYIDTRKVVSDFTVIRDKAVDFAGSIDIF